MANASDVFYHHKLAYHARLLFCKHHREITDTICGTARRVVLFVFPRGHELIRWMQTGSNDCYECICVSLGRVLEDILEPMDDHPIITQALKEMKGGDDRMLVCMITGKLAGLMTLYATEVFAMSGVSREECDLFRTTNPQLYEGGGTRESAVCA